LVRNWRVLDLDALHCDRRDWPSPAFGCCAGGGGSISAFVLLPTEGRLAILDVETGHVMRTMAVPYGPGLVAAGIDGRRVLIANTRLGGVTETDGLNGRRLHVFRGLGHLVDLVLVPRREFGLIQSRYAVVADAQGCVYLLDLGQGRIVRRTSVPHPVALAHSVRGSKMPVRFTLQPGSTRG
jgi:hypothetical protein